MQQTKLSKLQKKILLVIFETYNDVIAFNVAERDVYGEIPIKTYMRGGGWFAGYQYTTDGPLVLWRAIGERSVSSQEGAYPITGMKRLQGYSRQSVSRALKRLEERGLLRRYCVFDEGVYLPWAMPCKTFKDNPPARLVGLTLPGLAVTNNLVMETVDNQRQPL